APSERTASRTERARASDSRRTLPSRLDAIRLARSCTAAWMRPSERVVDTVAGGGQAAATPVKAITPASAPRATRPQPGVAASVSSAAEKTSRGACETGRDTVIAGSGEDWAESLWITGWTPPGRVGATIPEAG